MFWGWDVGSPPPWGEEEWTAWALERLGMPPPTEGELDQAARDIALETGCTFVSVAVDGGQGVRHFVAAAGSVLRQGEEELPAERPRVRAEWREQLEDFSEELGLPWTEPRWGGNLELAS